MVCASRLCLSIVCSQAMPATSQVLYESSQAQTREAQAELESQKRRKQQLEEEVSSSQAHIAELTTILKSAVRTSSISREVSVQNGLGVRLGGQAGVHSPRSGSISQEGSASEIAPRLRSHELQGM